MAWYYERNGEQIGPVEDPLFDKLVREGIVKEDTIVWNPTMTEWLPRRQVYRLPSQRLEAVLNGGESGTCCECGREFQNNQMVALANGFVCVGCRPEVMRKLQKDMANANAKLEYAGFWIRFAAVFVDGLVLQVVFIPLSAMLGTGLFAIHHHPSLQAVLVFQLIAIFIPMVYQTVCVGEYGATIGKMAVGIKIIRADGSRLTYEQAFWRFWAKMISGLTCGIGYLIVAFDDEKRALHDHICGTQVVYK